MQDFEIDGTKYSIPTSWDEITLKQQIEAEILSKDNPDFTVLTHRAAYCGIPLQVLKQMNIHELKRLFEKLDFLSTPLPSEPISSFKLNGREYSVLDSLLGAEAQDFISTEAIIRGNQEEPTSWMAVPKLIAVIAKRDGESLDSFKIEDRAKEFESLPLPIANQLYLFFCLIGNAFTNDAHKTLEQQDQVITMLISNIKTTATQQDGMGWSGRLRMKILQKYTAYLERGWKKFYSGFQSKV